jgi:hypothetical protein
MRIVFRCLSETLAQIFDHLFDAENSACRQRIFCFCRGCFHLKKIKNKLLFAQFEKEKKNPLVFDNLESLCMVNSICCAMTPIMLLISLIQAPWFSIVKYN